MDPQRLLLDEDVEAERVTREMLQRHVANNLYNISTREWVIGAVTVHGEQLAKQAKMKAARAAALKRRARRFVKVIVLTVMVVAVAFVSLAYTIFSKVRDRVRKLRGMIEDEEGGAFGGFGAPDGPGGTGRAGGADDDSEAGERVDRKQQIIERTRHFFLKRFKEVEGVAGKAIAEVVDLEEEGGEDGKPRKEMLDTTYMIEDEDDDGPGGSGGAGGGGGGGDDEGLGGLMPRDNLMNSVTIDDYMQYRCKPFCTHVERLAPWFALRLQVIEIFIFSINSSGAVLVGVGEEYVPYVALTVAVAAVLNSYLEFSRLAKKVEAYNSAQRDLHNLMNVWDGMTRTERRTRATIQMVVGTVENAHQLVAISLTDAVPSSQQGQEGEGEGEGEGEKKE